MGMKMRERTEQQKLFKVPHTYVIIFMIILLASVATYLVPAGEFVREVDPDTGRTIAVFGSYHSVEQNPVSFLDIFRSIPKGMTQAGWIIFLVFVIGGSFGIINDTGAIEAGIGRAVSKFEGREKLIIPITMLIFALGGATFGMAESTLIFIPMGIVLARALKFDALVGLAIVNLGAVAGFSGGALNIFTTGVAQGIAGLPIFSGMMFRAIATLVFVIIMSIYVLKYALKIKNNPELSIVYELENTEQHLMKDAKVTELNSRHKLVLLAIAIGFGVIIYGVTHGWSTGSDLSAIFLLMGITSGLIYGYGPSKIAECFVEGAKGLTFGALVIGLSRGIVVILQDAQVIDSIINGAAMLIGQFTPIVASGFMFVVQIFVNFFINSGSGQAATTMPLMAPLADMVGVTRQTAVLAYNLGDGLSNSIFPTSGVLLAGLSIAKIRYEDWFKFIWKLFIIVHTVALILIMLSTAIGYGPF